MIQTLPSSTPTKKFADLVTFSHNEDEYSREMYYRGARWVAHLSDGTSVVQDDGRPGLEDESGWIRLAKYLYINDLRITSVDLQFRTQMIKNILSAEADGYFFCKSLSASLNTDERYAFYILGYIKGEVIYTQKWLVPLLIMVEDGTRPVDWGHPCVILNDRQRTTISAGSSPPKPA